MTVIAAAERVQRLSKSKRLRLDLASENTKAEQQCSATCWKEMAGTTRLELATSAVTGQRSNQLNYVPGIATGIGGQCRTRTCGLLLVREAL